MQGRLVKQCSTSSPAQPNRYWKNDSLAVALISPVVAALDVKLGIVEVAQATGNSSAEVEAARILGIRGQRLLDLKDAILALNSPPPIPYLPPCLLRPPHLAVPRNPP